MMNKKLITPLLSVSFTNYHYHLDSFAFLRVTDLFLLIVILIILILSINLKDLNLFSNSPINN